VLPASITIDGTRRECTISNLSVGGALVSDVPALRMDVRVKLTFALPDLEEVVEIHAKVRWSTVNQIGLQFEGMRAREVWALNRYLKSLRVDAVSADASLR
jgi:hypothetical protein